MTNAAEKGYLNFSNVTVERRRGRNRVIALRKVTLRIEHGEHVGILGQSGSGKSTLLLVALGLLSPTSGSFSYGDVTHSPRPAHRSIGAIPQDPGSSLDPSYNIQWSLREPLRVLGIKGVDADTRITQALHDVGLADSLLSRRPHELSGGERQRVAFARALVVDPGTLVADEPTSALDISSKLTVLATLRRITSERSLTLVFVSHDPFALRATCDRIVVLHEGSVVEDGPTHQIFENPRHEQTRRIIDGASSTW
ncbi:MAG: ABC transporter ATP-binding protein [Acidimicrobiales bacterium]